MFCRNVNIHSFISLIINVYLSTQTTEKLYSGYFDLEVNRIKNFNIDFIYETTFAKTFNFREQAVDVVEDKQYLFHIKFSKESD